MHSTWLIYLFQQLKRWADLWTMCKLLVVDVKISGCVRSDEERTLA